MKRKNVMFLSIVFVVAVIVAGGILWYSQKVQRDVAEVSQTQNDVEKNGKEKIDNKNTESDSEKIRENKKKEFEALYTNVDEKLKTGELVWYSIPELGIKIPVNKKMKEELIYSGTKNSVGFSTTVLMGINPKECGAENAPLGGISRGKGSAEERVYKPCHPVYQDKDTYFCYTSIQSPCLTREQEENNKELLSDGIRIDWESPILWKYIQFTK